jgi:hypothetical protein
MIEVRHFERDPAKEYTFDWTAGEIVQPDKDASQSANVLWQGTFPYPWLGGELVAQEWEIWHTAENPDNTNALPVYFDIFPI